MRVLFVCPNFEPGRDGVGDYIANLVNELETRGVTCAVAALNDKGKAAADQPASSLNSPVRLRLPAGSSLAARSEALRGFAEQFQPDWISFHFVGFGYHPRGLPRRWVKTIGEIRRGRRLQIVFHELWCGLGRSAGLGERGLGWVQRWFVRWMLGRLRPERIQTSIASYGALLRRGGFDPAIVPVFGNIPLESEPSDSDWRQLLARPDLGEWLTDRENFLVVGLFGAIYPCAALPGLFRRLGALSGVMGRQLRIVSLGITREDEALRALPAPARAAVVRTGFLSAGLLNRVMARVDVAVAVTPLDGLGKSTTVHAWLERGVPVLIADEGGGRGPIAELPRGVVPVDGGSDAMAALALSGQLPRGRSVAAVAAAYLAQWNGPS